MSLAVALNSARSSLLTTAKQISVSGRNIAGANDPDYVRKVALTTSSADGSVRLLSITRAADLALYDRVLDAKSASTGQQALLDGLDRLQQTVGDTDSQDSPAARIAALSAALQAAANTPSDRQLAQAAVTAAKDVATALASATDTTQSVRSDADAAMADSVGSINDLLDRFATLNTAIVRGSGSGDDVTSALDQRDAILSQLSEEVGISVVQRDNNDLAVYTDGGVPLFDRTARTVSFRPSGRLTAGASGNAVMIDGVPVTGDSATMPLRSGRLAGLATLRDETAPTYQAQLDEMARALVETFAESDQSGGGGADMAGLFTYSGGPAIPASGTAVAGLAGDLRVNPAVDPAAGGNATLLRDGGINGAAYRYNTTGAASFADRLGQLVGGLTTARTFDGAAALGSGLSLSDFSIASVSWINGERKTVTASVAYQDTLLSRASDALSNASGVNMDDEYATQLQLEQSYAASSKLLGVINEMFNTLLNATG